MADEPAAEPLDELQEEEGGPVKSFLEHLEDLRWVLIKSLSAAGVAMVLCFFAGDYVFRVLKWPLDRAPINKADTQSVRVMLGTNQLGVFHPGTNDALASLAGTNRYVRLDLVPVNMETNGVEHLVLGVKVVTEAEAPPRVSPIDIVSLGPAAAFVVATKIAFFGGLIISSPFIFYFVAHFVFPALRIREKRYVYRGLIFGAGLFLTGVSFCYFVMMPVALAVSAKYAEWFGFKANQWRAEEYIGFVCKFMLGMGLGFEMPVIILTLVKIGILNYGILKSARRYVIVIAFVLGAVLTTPEVITQILMAIPLLLLYEISVWIAWYWERQEKKREAEAETAGA
ncbi:MAG TPA: twin-arginine translocase subunit TatC [Candidatus Binatia bacterium]|jgi:sec-independent protein translocase protein TatC|nr:twin-arginine translocase subunit TatC [Candidatus Binatia bacterium]